MRFLKGVGSSCNRFALVSQGACYDQGRQRTDRRIGYPARTSVICNGREFTKRLKPSPENRPLWFLCLGRLGGTARRLRLLVIHRAVASHPSVVGLQAFEHVMSLCLFFRRACSDMQSFVDDGWHYQLCRACSGNAVKKQPCICRLAYDYVLLRIFGADGG